MPSRDDGGSLAWRTRSFFHDLYPFPQAFLFSPTLLCCSGPGQQAASSSVLLFGFKQNHFPVAVLGSHSSTHILSVWNEGVRWLSKAEWFVCLLMLTALERVGLRDDDSAVKNICYSWRKLSLIPSVRRRQLRTASNSSSRGSEACGLCEYLHLRACVQTETHTCN